MEEYVETMASVLMPGSYSVVLRAVFAKFVATWKDL
jgi:hypothetical protein